jgi:RNAse (barnase) inhibitor barstar
MWGFDQPPNAATMTTTHVMRDGAVITRAYHDEEDHGWQFYSEHVTHTKDAMVVALEEIVALDQSIIEISNLPPGWMAQRTGRGFPWQRAIQYADATRVTVDWSKIMREEDFYNTILPQCGSPKWHGRNLDALADSWVTGGIDQYGPPYTFEFCAIDSVSHDLIGFRDAVLKIAMESIDENGGRYITCAEHPSIGQPATRPLDEPESDDSPQPETKERSR